eukprot:scaffold1667_cov258-Pinguiococcus_pyrenoidosus.AAC.12
MTDYLQYVQVAMQRCPFSSPCADRARMPPGRPSRTPYPPDPSKDGGVSERGRPEESLAAAPISDAWLARSDIYRSRLGDPERRTASSSESSPGNERRPQGEGAPKCRLVAEQSGLHQSGSSGSPVRRGADAHGRGPGKRPGTTPAA